MSPKPASFTGIIDAILEADKQAHVKQRHTAVRILERLREEHGFTGSYTIVRNYVNKAGIRQKEMFVPLVHLPGHAQVDFGEADGYIGGKRVRFHYFCLICRIRMAALSKLIPLKIPNPFWMGMSLPLRFWAGYHNRSCMITPGWR